MIWDWLLSPADPARAHDVGVALSWHARTMVLGWGVLAPSAVIAARYFKVLPGQKWPKELDNKTWWRWHWISQSLVLVLSAIGLGLILVSEQNTGTAILHRTFGYSVLVLGLFQALSGLLRGSKGGPTSRAADGSLRGDHYDMTLRRQLFETYHKLLGYIALILMIGAFVSGLWQANAPKWMWIFLSSWWLGLLFVAFVLEKRGWAFDTYQAIWGPDPSHPGNRMTRLKDKVQAPHSSIGPYSKKRDM